MDDFKVLTAGEKRLFLIHIIPNLTREEKSKYIRKIIHYLQENNIAGIKKSLVEEGIIPLTTTYSSPQRYGAIYFAFTRTPDNIFHALKEIIHKQNPSDNSKMYVEWENLVIIDCYTQFAKRKDKKLYEILF